MGDALLGVVEKAVHPMRAGVYRQAALDQARAKVDQPDGNPPSPSAAPKQEVKVYCLPYLAHGFCLSVKCLSGMFHGK